MSVVQEIESGTYQLQKVGTQRKTASFTLVGRELDVVLALMEAGRETAQPYDLPLYNRIIDRIKATCP